MDQLKDLFFILFAFGSKNLWIIEVALIFFFIAYISKEYITDLNQQAAAEQKKDNRGNMLKEIDELGPILKDAQNQLDADQAFQINGIITLNALREVHNFHKEHVKKRRQMYATQQWKAYEKHIKEGNAKEQQYMIAFAQMACTAIGLKPYEFFRVMANHPQHKVMEQLESMQMQVIKENLLIPAGTMREQIEKAAIWREDALQKLKKQKVKEDRMPIEHAKIEDHLFVRFDVEMDLLRLILSQGQHMQQEADELSETLDRLNQEEYDDSTLKERLSKLLPIQKDEQGNIPFDKFCLIKQALSKKSVDQDFIDRRREAYKRQDWDAYEKEVISKIKSDQENIQNKYKILKEVTGLSEAYMNQQMSLYPMDLDKRALVEKAMYGSQKSSLQSSNFDITKEQALQAIKYLQTQSVESYKTVRTESEKAKDSQAKFQQRCHILMAKARDKVYIEDKIDETAIDWALQKFDLENDKQYQSIMRESEKQMLEAVKSFEKKNKSE